MERTTSPSIEQLSWGRLEVKGFTPFKDAKLYPGGAREWVWRETGTHHVPGIQTQDVQELIDHGARIVILSQGMYRMLHVPESTVDWLKEKGITVEIAQTEDAVKRYNDLAKTEHVGALIHSTC